MRSRIEATVAYLQQPQAIRDQCQQLFDLCQANQLEHFGCDLSQLEGVAAYVIDTTLQTYPDFDVPFHSRWRHFNAGGVPRLRHLDQVLDSQATEIAGRSRLDLAVVSVLLDAGAGEHWRYHDCLSDQVLGRSEGLAVASLHAFEQGVFSSDPHHPYQVNGNKLQQLTETDLAQVFQVNEHNQLVGLKGRLALLHQLGATLTHQPERFGHDQARPGYLLDYWQGIWGQSLDAGDLLTEVLISFGPIWPGRTRLAGINLGDVWPHAALPTGNHWVPFHKLSQWLTYSLVEPLTTAGFTIVNLNALTGLAEYRNGGLCVDLGLIVPKQAAVTQKAYPADSTVVVEWRALTVILLDLIADEIRNQLSKTSDELPLIQILEGGTWSAGRRIAKQLRLAGTPPISIQSDGTVF